MVSSVCWLGYTMEHRGIVFGFTTWQEIFFCTPNSPPRPIFNVYRGIYWWTKWSRCEADHPHHLVSRLRISGTIPPPPSLSSLRAQADFIALFCSNSVTYTWERFGFGRHVRILRLATPQLWNQPNLKNSCFMKLKKKSLRMDYTFCLTCGFLLSTFLVVLYYSLKKRNRWNYTSMNEDFINTFTAIVDLSRFNNSYLKSRQLRP